MEIKMYADKEYIIALRREIHEYPEIGFDLPKTIATVKRELDDLGIEYTEKYGESSVVATINPQKSHFTIGIRADMDALLIQERQSCLLSLKSTDRCTPADTMLIPLCFSARQRL